MTVQEMAQQSRQAALELAVAKGADKSRALLAIAAALEAERETVFAANAADLQAAAAEELALPLLKRLKFDDAKLHDVCAGLRALAAMEEPIGKMLAETELAEGMLLQKITCPLGVIGVIFESRPDALVQIAALCLKSGNACLLKGGREALRTNSALTAIIQKSAAQCGIPAGFAVLLESREDVNALLTCDEYVDLIIPRGSNSFVRYIMEHTKIPVMGHSDGICHTYVDAAADFELALRVLLDAKTQYVSACNATETVLIQRSIAAEFLPSLAQAFTAAGVKMYGCSACRMIVPDINKADEQSYQTEYLDYAVSLKVVDSLEEAVQHINHYGSGHTDAIITQDQAAAELFTSRVDAADVFVNCSTRFADGFRFGFGAEVGISTSKIHARGPVGLDGLLSYKYILYGSGQAVADFASGRCHYTHRKLR